MATLFKVRGLGARGELLERRVHAGNREEAERAARSIGLKVLDVRAEGFFSAPSFAARVGPAGDGAGGFDLALFAHELATLLGAGLSLIEILETLAEREEGHARAGQVLGELVRRMQEGQAFSAALRTFPSVFPELFVASVAASEHTGELAHALHRYLRYHEQLGAIRRKIVSASLYPAMLCVVGSAVALFLLCFLVPRFSRVYEGMEDRLPLASRWLMQWGGFASEHWALIVAASCRGHRCGADGGRAINRAPPAGRCRAAQPLDRRAAASPAALALLPIARAAAERRHSRDEGLEHGAGAAAPVAAQRCCFGNAGGDARPQSQRCAAVGGIDDPGRAAPAARGRAQRQDGLR